MAATAQAAGDAPRVKIHLILNGYAICATRQREGGRQALTTLGVFKLLLDDERCERCAAKLRRIEDPQRDATQINAHTETHTCPKCGVQGAAFICSEPGCPVNGGAAYGPAPPASEQSTIFRDHRCVRCMDGEKPCVQGHPNGCSWPHARND